MSYDILMPQIIFIISGFNKKPSLDYVIAVTQLLAYLVHCIILSYLDPTTHYDPVNCLFFSMVCFASLSAMRPMYLLHYLVVISECQIYIKKTSCVFMHLYTNNQFKKLLMPFQQLNITKFRVI